MIRHYNECPEPIKLSGMMKEILNDNGSNVVTFQPSRSDKHSIQFIIRQSEEPLAIAQCAITARFADTRRLFFQALLFLSKPQDHFSGQRIEKAIGNKNSRRRRLPVGKMMTVELFHDSVVRAARSQCAASEPLALHYNANHVPIFRSTARWYTIGAVAMSSSARPRLHAIVFSCAFSRPRFFPATSSPRLA